MCNGRWDNEEKITLNGDTSQFDGDVFGVCVCDCREGTWRGDLILHGVRSPNPESNTPAYRDGGIWIGMEKPDRPLQWVYLSLEQAQEFGVRLVHAATNPEQYDNTL